MRLRVALILLSLTLLLSIIPCYAAVYLTSDDFADPHPVISPKKDYYKEGDEISLNYTIAPRTENDAVKLDGRYYDLHTSLNNPKFDVIIAYKNGGVLYPNIKYGLKDANIEVGEWEDGLDYLKIKLKGSVPAPKSRVDEIPVLWVNVSDAAEDALPSVKIKVVNIDMFSKDLSSLKTKLEKLKADLKELDEMGADVLDIDKLLKSASTDLNKAEDYYKQGRYLNADDKLKNVEENLDKAEKEINKVGAEFLYDEAQKKLDEVKLSIVQFEYLIQQAKNKNIVVTLYEFNLTKVKSEYSIQLEKLERARNYIEDGEYDSAKKKAKEVIDGVEKIKSKIETNIAQLQNMLGGGSKPTPTSQPAEGFNLNAITKAIDVKIVAIVALVLVVGFIVYKGRGRFGRRRKWDELR